MMVIIMLSISIALMGSYFIKTDIIDKAQIKVEHDLNLAAKSINMRPGILKMSFVLHRQDFF